MSNLKENSVLTTKDWLVTIFISSIPVVGLIMLFVWAFGGNVNKNKENWAKGMLLMMAIVLGVYIMLMVLFGVTILAGASGGSV